MPPVARIGDLHSHGGQVITGSAKHPADGIPVARIGDLVFCPIHGVNPIVTGSPSVLEGGSNVARITSLTACGATIITGSPKYRVP